MTGVECAFFGTLTRDADHRISQNGKPYTRLNVVVGDGDARQFVSAIVFGDAAREVAALEKDRRVYVEGRIEINEWTGNDGVKRTGLKVTSFNAREVSKIGRRRERKQPAPSPAVAAPLAPKQEQSNDFYSDEIPF